MNMKGNIGVDFIIKLISTFVLVVGYVIIVTDEFNGIAAIIFMAPCFIDTMKEISKGNKNIPLIRKIDVTCCFSASLYMVSVIMWIRTGQNNELFRKFLELTASVYPVRELIHTVILYYMLQKEEEGE